MYRSENMHYIFCREYFEGKGGTLDLSGRTDNTALVEQRNRDLINFSFCSFDFLAPVRACDGFCTFSLYVTYPGLLIGVGSPHDASVKGAINGGFSFDYVTGLPVIPGSSLKGILRSCFSGGGSREERRERQAWLRSQLPDRHDMDMDALETACFEKNDVFLGVYPFPFQGTEKLLEKENFAPQKELSDPNILTFVKLRPNVKLDFAFLLFDDEQNGFSAEDKQALYRKLLLEVGVGAKTNEGYGRLSANRLSGNQAAAAAVSRGGNSGYRGGNSGYRGGNGRNPGR